MQQSKKIPFDLVERNFSDIFRLLYLEYYYLALRYYSIFKINTSINNLIETFFESILCIISIPINIIEHGKYLIKLSDKSIPNYAYTYSGNELNLFLFTIIKTTSGKGLISENGIKILNPIYDKIKFFYCENLLVIETTLKNTQQIYLYDELNLLQSEININTQIEPFIKEYFNWKDYIEIHGIELYKKNIIDKYRNINLWKFDYDTTFIGNGLSFNLKVNIKKLNFYKDSIFNSNQIINDSFFLLKHEDFDNKRYNLESQKIREENKTNVLSNKLYSNCIIVYNNKIIVFDTGVIIEGYGYNSLIYFYNNDKSNKYKFINTNGFFDSNFIFSYPNYSYNRIFLIYNRIENNITTLTILNSKFKTIENIQNTTDIVIFSVGYKTNKHYQNTVYYFSIFTNGNYHLYNDEFENLGFNLKNLKEIETELSIITKSKFEDINSTQKGLLKLKENSIGKIYLGKMYEIEWNEIKTQSHKS
jgi:hypothetical protein